ncbi:MAG: tyrosine-type recombinase/integrase [Nitrospiria bacterium]
MGSSLPVTIFGEPMKRGSIRCSSCNTSCREKDYSCPKCGCITRAISMKWAGSKKPYRFTRDKNDKPLYHPEALLTLREINHKIDKGKFDPSEYLTTTIKGSIFETVIEKWFKEKREELEKADFAPGTYHPYRSYAKNYYIPFFGGMSVREIGEAEIKRFQKSLPKERASHYRKNIYQGLKTFFGWLYESGEIKEPVKFKKLPKSVRRALEPLSFEDQQAAINRIPVEHRDLFRFCAEASLRMGEACAFQVGDLDYAPGKIMVQRTWSGALLIETTKQKKKQAVALSDVAQGIATRDREGKLPGAFLFINLGTHRGYRDEFLRRLWGKYSRINLTLYEAMRHSTITDWASMGSAYDVQQSARHTDMRTTMKYVHAVDDRLNRMVNRGEVVKFGRRENG